MSQSVAHHLILKPLRTAWRKPSCRLSFALQLSAKRTISTAPNHAAQASMAAEVTTSEPHISHQVPLTAKSYPSLQRSTHYKTISAEDVKFFRSILPHPSAIIDGTEGNDHSDDLAPYNDDWTRKYRGQSKLVLKPASTAEVSKILHYCNSQKLAVVPQGGNSGLVGGSVPIFDEIIVNLSRMNQIRSFDEASGVVVVDAGCILETTDAYLAQKNHIFPLDLGAKGSCHIGGNVATNAGGLRLLRYGSLHGSVLGLEAVLADGTIFDDLCVLRKNNTGYDLKQLLIGSEGTIGIITAVSVQCPKRPSSRNVAFLGLKNYEMALEAFKMAKSSLSEILSAFELMDGQSQRIVHSSTQKPEPLQDKYPFYCLVETSGSNASHDQEKLEKYFEAVIESDIVADGVLAQDESQIAELWSLRESIPESLGHAGGVYKYDVSIPLLNLYDLVLDTREHLKSLDLLSNDATKPVLEVVGYGHMGDSNLHLNVVVQRYDKKVEAALEPFVYEWIARHKGSISAEHGLGLAKKQYISYSRNSDSVALMKQIKNLFDPHAILNPYKYI